jgi:MFS family permease
MPFYAIFVQLPQRFQFVNLTSAERAGILLLPTSLITPVGALLAGTFSTKIPIEFILIASAAVTCIGIALLSTLPTTPHIWPGMYGYEVITGLGLGLASPPYFMLVASAVREKELSVGTGALNMVRTLGGCVAVAICSAVHREVLNHRLKHFLSPGQIANVAASSGYVARLPVDVRERIGIVFGESYNRQFRIMVAFAGANVVVAIGLALVRKRLGVFGQMPSRERAQGSLEGEVEQGGKKEGETGRITEIE